MSTSAIIAIAVAVVVVLGALAFITLARRSDVRGAGALSAETVRRDKSARDAAPEAPPARTGADAEAEGVVARRGVELVPVAADTGLTPWVPPDPEALGVSRRQFFNRATIGLMGAGLGTFSAAAFVAFLWPTKTGGFGGKISVGRLDDINAGIRAGNGFFYAPEARAVDHQLPGRRLPKAEQTYQASAAARHEARASRSSTRSARTSAAACRSACRANGSNAAATARSTTRSARRRVARPRAAWITSPPRSRPPATSRSTPARSWQGHADRHQHHRPGGRRSALRGSR